MTEEKGKYKIYNHNGKAVRLDPLNFDQIPNDPNIVGPNTKVYPFSGNRDPNKYPAYPKQLMEIERSYMLPLADSIAKHCEVDLIDELTFNKIIIELREKFLFCVLSFQDIKINGGEASWDSFIIYARNHPVVKLRIRAKYEEMKAGIESILIWSRLGQAYQMIRDPSIVPRPIPRQKVHEILVTYLDKEILAYRSDLKEGEM